MSRSRALVREGMRDDPCRRSPVVAICGLGVEVVCDLTSIVLCKYERLVAPRLRYRRGRHDAGVSPTSGNLTPIACLPNSISIVTIVFFCIRCPLFMLSVTYS